jgi:hypothetical protein
MFGKSAVTLLAQTCSRSRPLVKIVVEVGPNYTQPVTLRFRSQETGALVWWTDAQEPPEATT